MSISFGKRLLEEVDAAARRDLDALAKAGRAAANEGLDAVNGFRVNVTRILDHGLAGEMNQLAVVRALESEREALAFRLGAITNRYVKWSLMTLLNDSLRLLGRLLGAGIGGLHNG